MRPFTAKILSVDSESPELHSLQEAVRLVKEGRVIAFPTDTVYGVGCLPEELPVRKLLETKRRRATQSAVLLICSPSELPSLVLRVPSTGRRLLERFWPGALTLIFEANRGIPSLLAPQGKVALRVPNHPVAHALLLGLGGPLASSSANISAGEDALTAQEAAEQLEEKVDLILDAGRASLGLPSTIVDVSREPAVLVRKGAIPLEDLRESGFCINSHHPFDVLVVCTGNSCRSPLAAALLEKRLPHSLAERVRVRSAGVACIKGMPATESAQAVAREEGLDLREHRSNPLTPKMVAEADLILVMESFHYEVIRQRFPGAAERVRYLRGFGRDVPEESRVIPDPFGQSIAVYRDCFRQMRLSTGEILKCIEHQLGSDQ